MAPDRPLQDPLGLRPEIPAGFGSDEAMGDVEGLVAPGARTSGRVAPTVSRTGIVPRSTLDYLRRLLDQF